MNRLPSKVWFPALIWLVWALQNASGLAQSEELTAEQWAQVEAIEQQRIQAIDSVVGSVIAIYGENRQGGGSGVIIDPSGIALTNHHVIMGAGISGWGGLSDGKLYHWTLIGTDPGGDVSIIQLEGRETFPFTPLADSDLVRIGDWALAMGNPFVLTEDQYPTVTLGIVSGVKRYQPGAGANQLVYGNCIQVDSSINPGNSGGPLFNFSSQVIGINGRGSFRERGRVNVGLGYAISSNQIKNFIPDLLATKLVEHGTLDANFSDRNGKVLCSTINQEAPVAQQGLELGDELLEFEGEVIRSANQFTNLICTLPADWPAQLKIRKKNGNLQQITLRLLGLPYPKPPAEGNEKQPAPGQEEDDQAQQMQAMRKLLSAPAGEIRDRKVNQRYATQLLEGWERPQQGSDPLPLRALHVEDELIQDGEVIGTQEIFLLTDGRFRIRWKQQGVESDYWDDGQNFYQKLQDRESQQLSLVEAKLNLPIIQAMGMLAPNLPSAWDRFGEPFIDGSDKAQAQVAYRLRQLDDNQDEFFFWVNFEDSKGPKHTLLKASAEKNLTEAGGVLYSDWQSIPSKPDTQGQEFTLPRRRSFVSGLDEIPSVEIVNRKTEWLDQIEEDWFTSEDPH